MPFAYSQENEVFNGDLEKAAVFCTSELKREKGGGFFKKQDGENLIFISKILYPFWLAPFKDMTLLLDGLNIASCTINYSTLPDSKVFIENLKQRALTRQALANFLSNNQNYFQVSNNEQKLTVEGFINDKDFTMEFLNYTKNAPTTNLPIVEALLVSPALDEEGVFKMLQSVENTWLKLTEETSELYEVIKLLNSKKQEAQSNLRGEIKDIKDEFSVKIQKEKAVVDDIVSKINKAYSGEVTKVSDIFEQKIKVLQKDVVKFEKKKEQLEEEIEHVNSEIKTAAINKDSSAEQKWKEERNKLKDKRPAVSSTLKELEKHIDDVEENRKTELFQLKQDNNAKIKEASKDLVELEVSRDSEIKVYQNEIAKIEELTSNIIDKVDELAKNRETKILEFNQLGVKHKMAGDSLVYMSFYLSGYQSKSNKRYVYLEPSDVSNGGLSTRLKALGKTKISQLFQPKSRKITSILNSFICLMSENKVFNCEISEACLKVNLSRTEKAETLRNGLSKLKEQGWLSNAEFVEFNQKVSQYFSNCH